VNEQGRIPLTGRIHFLAGLLHGLHDGLGHVKNEDLDLEMIDRIRSALKDAAKLADELTEEISKQ